MEYYTLSLTRIYRRQIGHKGYKTLNPLFFMHGSQKLHNESSTYVHRAV
jgi:hypothetical protein